MILAIDPGRDTGWALMGPQGQLVACGLGEGYRRWAAQGPGDEAWVEFSLLRGAGETNPNAIVKLALSAGTAKGWLESKGWPVRTPQPEQWKGQTPKDVHHARHLPTLSETERIALRAVTGLLAESKKHNVWDAVCLGLWAVGRIRGPKSPTYFR